MNGYKTGGDWTDVTSIGRNEIVFEGRHKDYGAFYIRQRYTNALFLSLLSAIGFVGLSALVPYAFHGRALPHPLRPNVVVTPHQYTLQEEIIIPPPPHIQPHHNSESNNTPPVIIAHTDTTSHIVTHAPTTISSPGPATKGPDITPSNPGPPAPPAPPIDNTPVKWVPEMPKFPGGNVEQYLAGQLRYPEQDVQIGLQGTVYVSFVIERDGSISGVKILRGITNGDDLNREAVRVISEMPKWIPGKQDGHPVRVEYMVPIRFKLQ